VPGDNIAAVVLAAGQARRFGSDKLMAPLDGIPMGLHIARTIAKMDFGWRFAVCITGAALMQHFSALGFATIENDAPDMGQAHSLHLAIRAAEQTQATALLVTLADMPFVATAHIDAVLAGEPFAASSSGATAMPPALFPRDMWPRLLATSGDAGARALLDGATLVAALPAILRDIDTPADLPASK
jgi:molybdenum cofactor cytidylyltransferase